MESRVLPKDRRGCDALSARRKPCTSGGFCLLPGPLSSGSPGALVVFFYVSRGLLCLFSEIDHRIYIFNGRLPQSILRNLGANVICSEAVCLDRRAGCVTVVEASADERVLALWALSSAGLRHTGGGGHWVELIHIFKHSVFVLRAVWLNGALRTKNNDEAIFFTVKRSVVPLHFTSTIPSKCDLFYFIHAFNTC